MGTSCLTRVKTSDGKQLLNMYRQFDGYLNGHGAELFELLDGMKIVNGMSNSTDKQSNGAGCLAAQIVSHFKTEAGGSYIYPIESTDCGQNYEYVITVTEADLWAEIPVAGALHVAVNSYNGELFQGTVKEFGEKIASNEDEE